MYILKIIKEYFMGSIFCDFVTNFEKVLKLWIDSFSPHITPNSIFFFPHHP
jgi:hypothetical protein